METITFILCMTICSTIAFKLGKKRGWIVSEKHDKEIEEFSKWL